MTFHIDRFFALFFLSLPLFSQAGERFSAREAIPEADTISFGDKGPVSIAQDDSLMLRQIFDSDTFEGISEIDMAAPDILAVPDSVIQHRLKVLDARSPLSLEFNPEVRALHQPVSGSTARIGRPFGRPVDVLLRDLREHPRPI